MSAEFDKDLAEKLNVAADIIQRGNLDPGKAMQVVDDVAGKPDYGKLIEDRIKCVCGREFPVSVFPAVNTGVTTALYNVCPSCTKDTAELAHLCCLTCKAVVGHLYPHKEPTGFVFEGGKFYHIHNCPQCSKKERGKADIIEKILFFKANNIPMKSDPLFEKE